MGSREIGRAVVAVIWAGLTAAGCEREPLEQVCPTLGEGDLAVSEIRGSQTGSDTWGQWFEIYNATGDTLNLSGLSLNIRKLDGSSERQIVVRNPDLRSPAGGYTVLGRFPDDLTDPDDLPDHVDYGFEDDFPSDFYVDALLDVQACGELIDRVIYHDLPKVGSLSFDGALLPGAAANDNEDDWCVDDTEVQPGDGGTTTFGVPGTPGEVNRPCN